MWKISENYQKEITEFQNYSEKYTLMLDSQHAPLKFKHRPRCIKSEKLPINIKKKIAKITKCYQNYQKLLKYFLSKTPILVFHCYDNRESY